MSRIVTLASVTCLSVCWLYINIRTNDPFIAAIFERVSREQVLEDQQYKPLRSWGKSKGDYSCNIVLNFHGYPLLAEARRLTRIYDNNMFVTALVTSVLLEAFQYGRAPRPSDQQLTMSIHVLKHHQDKNRAYNNSIMSFYQQTLNNSTHHWQSNPVNILGVLNLLDSLPLHVTAADLKTAGLQDVVKYIESVKQAKSMLSRTVQLTPDFDATFVYVTLGSLLLQQKDEFPIAWELWNSHNTNLTSVFDALKKYAYRPFSADSSVNSIDPRTYFYIRGYLDQAKTNGQDVALVPTFIHSEYEELVEYDKGVGKHYKVNNVDVTVAANIIFGITSAVLSGLVSQEVLEDPLIAQIYHNSSSLIAYEIMNNFSGRPDLALTYYPSRMEFYWFVTRTVASLESARRNGTLLVKVMDTVYTILRDVIDKHVTQNILSMANKEGADQVYFDDFLGDGDLTDDGRPLIRGEDRIFTTSMAANALLSGWTYYDVISGKNHWKEGTPETVQETASGCVKWLRQHTLDGQYDPWNVVFTFSTKGANTFPFWYPGNRFEYLNGTAITDRSNIPSSPFIYAVQGYVPADQYNVMLKEKHFGQPTPLTFNGYNDGSSCFPVWSSVPYTYSTTLHAVSRFDNLVV